MRVKSLCEIFRHPRKLLFLSLDRVIVVAVAIVGFIAHRSAFQCVYLSVSTFSLCIWWCTPIHTYTRFNPFDNSVRLKASDLNYSINCVRCWYCSWQCVLDKINIIRGRVQQSTNINALRDFITQLEKETEKKNNPVTLMIRLFDLFFLFVDGFFPLKCAILRSFFSVVFFQ